jgi:hypothetical protein
MPRKRAAVEQPESPPGPAAGLVVIPDDAILTLAGARRLLGLAKGCLPREGRLGRLRVAKRAGRSWTTGRWIREWIERGEVQRPRKAETAERSGAAG